MVLGSYPGGHPEESGQMVQCWVLRPMEKPISKTTHRWPGVPKTRTRTHRDTKGGGRRRRPPPLWGRPKAASLVSCHNRDLALSQQTSCLATAHIFSCRIRYPSRQDTICVSPSSFNMRHPSSCMHYTRCIVHHLFRTRELPMLFGHNSTLVAPFGASMGGIGIIFQRTAFLNRSQLSGMMHHA